MKAATRSGYLAIALLATTGWAAALEEPPASNAGLESLRAATGQTAEDKAEFEKKTRQEMQLLASSDNPEDRISAVEHLSGLLMDQSLLWKLMNDPDRDVREAAIWATMPSSCTVDTHFSPEMVRQMTAFLQSLLEKELTPHRGEKTLYYLGEMNEKDQSMVITAALALDSIYLNEFIIGIPQYRGWEEDVLLGLVTHLALVRADISDSLDHGMLRLLKAIDTPEAAVKALKVTLENTPINDFSAGRQIATLETLWKHPLLGHDKPMNLILLKELSPILEPMKAHILSLMSDGLDKQQATLFLDEISAAVEAAKK